MNDSICKNCQHYFYAKQIILREDRQDTIETYRCLLLDRSIEFQVIECNHFKECQQVD